MALQTAASGLRSVVLFIFLFIYFVFCRPSLVTFTREQLLNIGLSTAHTIPLLLNEPQTFPELLVGGAAALFGILQKRRRGKRAGALVKLRQWGFRTVLPSIHLVNVHSMANKMDELLLFNSNNLDFCRSAALCFTESCLTKCIPDSALHLSHPHGSRKGAHGKNTGRRTLFLHK